MAQRSTKRRHAAMTAEVVPAPSTASNVAAAIKQDAAAAAAAAASSSGDADDSDEPKKKARPSTSTGKATGQNEKSQEEIMEYLEETFDVRRSFITLEMPSIPEVKETYPYLFRGKHMLLEFQRISKVDIDHAIQEYCVKFAAAILASARRMSGAATILRQAETAKQENVTLRQYWDMVSAICLLPLLHRENLVEMVHEIGEDDEVDATGKIVPMLVSRGSIFSSDQFFLIAEETVLQEFEEFTMAFGSLFASYWVFNMEYPRTLHNTYMFVQRIMLHLRGDTTPLPPPCKMLVQRLTKWAREHRPKKWPGPFEGISFGLLHYTLDGWIRMSFSVVLQMHCQYLSWLFIVTKKNESCIGQRKQHFGMTAENLCLWMLILIVSFRCHGNMSWCWNHNQI